MEHSGTAPLPSSLECLGTARTLGGRVLAVLSGGGAVDVAPTLGRFGASAVAVLDGGPGWSPSVTAAALAEVVRAEGARACLGAATIGGRDLLPRVAAHLDCAFLSRCTGIRLEGSDLVVRRACYAGRFTATWRSHSPVVCATLQPGAFEPVETGEVATVEIREVDAALEPLERVVGVGYRRRLRPRIEDATTVVVIGGEVRGAPSPEPLEALADELGDAALGLTVSGAGYTGWGFPRVSSRSAQGVQISPRVCVAVGVDDVYDKGWARSELVLALNDSPRTRMLDEADYVVIGDPLEVVTRLTEAIRRYRAGS